MCSIAEFLSLHLLLFVRVVPSFDCGMASFHAYILQAEELVQLVLKQSRSFRATHEELSQRTRVCEKRAGCGFSGS